MTYRDVVFRQLRDSEKQVGWVIEWPETNGLPVPTGCDPHVIIDALIEGEIEFEAKRKATV